MLIAFRGGGEKIQHLAGIEADGDGVARVFRSIFSLASAVFRAGRKFRRLPWRRKVYGVRALIGSLRRGGGVGEFSASETMLYCCRVGGRLIVGKFGRENS